MVGGGDISVPVYGQPTPSRPFTPGKPQSWRSRVIDFTVPIVLPWVVFFLVTSLFIYAYHDLPALVWVIVAGCAFFGFIFVVLGANMGNGTFLALGFMCLTSVVMGSALGIWLEKSYLARYWTLEHGHETTEIDPLQSLDQLKGATTVRFLPSSFVDDRRTLGYIAKGRIYCVAPVAVRGNATSDVRFWALGEGCCEMRSNFDCGSARDVGEPAEGFPMPALVEEVQAQDPYFKAIEAANAVYGTGSPDGLVRLVNFVSDAKAAIDEIWNEALTVALIAVLVDLCVNAVAALVLGKILAPKAATKQELLNLRMP